MKIRVFVDTGFVGGKHKDIVEVDDNEWTALNETEKEELLNRLAIDFLHEVCDCGAYPIEEEE